MDIYLKCLEDFSLGGKGNTIEIDECKFGERRHNRGHHVGGARTFGVVECDGRKLFLYPVNCRAINSLENLLRGYAHPCSIIFSDFRICYSNLGCFFYIHETVNHSKEFVNRTVSAFTNTFEGN